MLPVAVHDRDRQRLHQLVEGVPAGSTLMVIESLAAIADEGVTVATRDPDAVREALASVALDLAMWVVSPSVSARGQCPPAEADRSRRPASSRPGLARIRAT